MFKCPFICINQMPLQSIGIFLPQETQSYKRNAMCMHRMLHQAGVPEPSNTIRLG